MPGKPALVAEGVGYVLDSNVSRVWMEQPEPDAGKGCDRAVGSHTPKKSCETRRTQFPPTAVVATHRDRLFPGRPKGVVSFVVGIIRARSPALRSPQLVVWFRPASASAAFH